ncbi:ABC transporter permease [Bacillus sp. 1P02SD]|uniref:ABC transporter permease n=1 Tax=Bacillus sp. 1P02SD TaxID=3132264 RepID=UPI0039A18B01
MKLVPSNNSGLNKKMDKVRLAEESGKVKKRLGNRALRKLLNNRLSVFGLVTFIFLVVVCVLAPIIAPYDPLIIDLSSVLQPPSSEHWLGTDKLGRDILSRILYGGQISILIGFGSAVGSAIIGVILGSYAGYKGGWIDAIILRISEIFMAFPQIILVLLLVAFLGQSMMNLIFIFVITGWCGVYRMVRARMLSIKEEEYVQALRAFGLNDFIICFKHMLPNAIGVVMVALTLNTAMFILQEAALSFLGLGVPFEIATWGNILNVANDLNVLKENWWIWFPVGIVISLFVLSVNFIGDGLRDSTDPSQQG